MSDTKSYIISNEVSLNPEEKIVNEGRYELDTNKIKIYEDFIRDCIDRKVEVYVVSSPYYVTYDSTDYSIRVGKEIAAKYHIPYFDFSMDPYFHSHPELFADIIHLNNKGATIFSNRVADSMMIS